MTKSHPTRENNSLSKKVLGHALNSLANHTIRELRDYYEALEDHFAQQQKEIEKRYEKESARYERDHEAQRDLGEYYADQLEEIEVVFLKQFRYSMSTFIHTTFEIMLDDLCRHQHHAKKLALAPEDVSGRGVERAERYLTKACLLSLPTGSHEWQELKKFNKIRNCIVHARGNIKKTTNPTELRRIIKNTKGVTLDASDRYIIIDRSYLTRIIDAIHTTITTLHNTI